MLLACFALFSQPVLAADKLRLSKQTTAAVAKEDGN